MSKCKDQNLINCLYVYKWKAFCMTVCSKNHYLHSSPNKNYCPVLMKKLSLLKLF